MSDSQAARFEALLTDRLGISDLAPKEGGPLVPVERHLELATALRDELGCTLFGFVAASHWEAKTPKRGDPVPEHYEVAYGLRSVGAGSHMATWRLWLDLGTPVPSLVPLFAGADWQEREQFDLVGVVFAGHPDLRRLMMPEEWVGHPLRRDYAIATGHVPWR